MDGLEIICSGWCHCPDNCLHDLWCCNISQHRERQSYGDTLHGSKGKYLCIIECPKR